MTDAKEAVVKDVLYKGVSTEMLVHTHTHVF